MRILHKVVIILTTLTTVFFAPSASAADLTVFGFELGKPLNLPECSYKTVETIKLYEVVPAATCVQDAQTINTYGQPVRRIIFSQKETPLIVKSWQMIALELDGNLVGIEFFTIGESAQELTLQTLTQKYGEPSTKYVTVVQNNYGATTDAITAIWKAKELTVTFDGINGRLDRGRVLIDTPKASALRQGWDIQESSGKRSM